MRHSPAEDGTARSLEQLAHLSRAEDFFRFFGLEYDPKVLTVHRLHVLKRFGLDVAAIEERRPLPDEPERLRLYGEALRRAHQLFAGPPGPEQRVFQVLQGGLCQLGTPRRKR
jgi:nitrogenase-stabilizing/protective protein